MNKLTAEYLAGFFDGEGCVYISKHKGKKNNPYYAVRLTIANTYKPVIDLIEEAFDGFTQRTSAEKSDNQRSAFACEIYRKDKIKEFIKMILPYTIVKKEQLIMALEFLEHMDISVSGKEVPKQIIDYREDLVNRIKKNKIYAY